MKLRNLLFAVITVVATIAIVATRTKASATTDTVAAITKLVNDDVNASLAGDANFVRDNYVDGYIEGSSYGSWIMKREFLDTSSNRVKSRRINDLRVDPYGDAAIARFNQTYEALVGGQERKRTVICTQTWLNQHAAWKLAATHCSAAGE